MSAILALVYKYNSFVRLGGDLINPNHLGLLLCLVFPCLWAVQFARRDKWDSLGFVLFILPELLLTVLLLLTFSRGSLTSYFLSLFLFLWCVWYRKDRSGSEIIWHLISRISFIIAFAIKCTLVFRIAEAFQGDRSVSNRLDVWWGGVKMIYDFPVWGVGKGNSGYMYMQWYQDPFAPEIYRGLVNSYLHIGAEYGLPAFFSVVFLLTGSSYLSYRRFLKNDNATRYFALATCCCIVAFSSANLFSSLWVFTSSKVALGLLLAAVLLSEVRAGKDLKRAVTDLQLPAIISAASVVLVYFTGASISLWGKAKWEVDFQRSGEITLTPRSGFDKQFVIYPDHAALGPYYGKTIRRTLSQLSLSNCRISVRPPGLESILSNDGVKLLFGSRCIAARLLTGTERGFAYWIAPTVAAPDQRLGTNNYLLLPGCGDPRIGKGWKKVVGHVDIETLRDCSELCSSAFGNILRLAIGDSEDLK